MGCGCLAQICDSCLPIFAGLLDSRVRRSLTGAVVDTNISTEIQPFNVCNSCKVNTMNFFEDVRRITIGVSACLVGHRVAYDGRLRPPRLKFLSRVLPALPICPESFGLKLGSPRRPLHLEMGHLPSGTEKSETYSSMNRAPQLVFYRNGYRVTVDHEMKQYVYERFTSVSSTNQRIDGYIGKRGSPSCGSLGSVVSVSRHTGGKLPRDPSIGGSFVAEITAQLEIPTCDAEDIDSGTNKDKSLAFWVAVLRLKRKQTLFSSRDIIQ